MQGNRQLVTTVHSSSSQGVSSATTVYTRHTVALLSRVLQSMYEGHLESKERFAIKKYLLIIGKKNNMQVLSHNFIYFST